MNRYIVALLVPCILQGCANESGARMGFTSASGPAMAILHEDLFTGEVVGYLDRTGTIDLKSALDPDVRCVGSFRYTGAKTGVAQVRCNDGNEAQLSFNSITALSGYGYGKSSRGPVSFTYGLTAEQSMKYLTLPRGRRLIRKPEGLRLERDI